MDSEFHTFDDEEQESEEFHLDEFKVNPTSSVTAAFVDIPLYIEKGDHTKSFRKALRATIVKHDKDPDAPLRVALLHQRRVNGSKGWEDYPAFNCNTLKGGQDVKMDLGCRETLKLYEALQLAYEISEYGIPWKTTTYRVITEDELVVQGDKKEAIKHLLEHDDRQFWDALAQLGPEQLRAIAKNQMYEDRENAYDLFNIQMELAREGQTTWKERKWGDFFQENRWIFGHGLSYYFLHMIKDQMFVGGKNLENTGGEYPDFGMASGAHVGFVVLVEIKRPDTPLVTSEKNRNGTYQLSQELIDAVGQCQSYCEHWDNEGSRHPSNQRKLDKQRIFSHDTRGIIVIGDTHDFDNDGDDNWERAATFHRFRNNLHNPEIITFDELLQRAKFMVSEHQ